MFRGLIMRHFADVTEFFRICRLYTAFTKKLEQDYFFAGQQHDFWEVVIVSDGQVGVTAGTDVFILSKGQAVIHEPMEFHRIWVEGNGEAEILIFTFSADNMPKYTDKLFSYVDIDGARSVLHSLRRTFTTGKMDVTGIAPDSGLNCQSALKKLELFILSLLSQESAMPSVPSRSAANYISIVKVLEENVSQSLSVSDIAQLCNMGQVNLKQTFSRYAGIGVMQYFNRLKVMRATEMIRQGATVQEAADSLGFANQNYFSTVFKRVTGRNPSSYKKEK